MCCEKPRRATKPRSNKFSGRPIVLGLARFMLTSGPFVTALYATRSCVRFTTPIRVHDNYTARKPMGGGSASSITIAPHFPSPRHANRRLASRGLLEPHGLRRGRREGPRGHFTRWSVSPVRAAPRAHRKPCLPERSPGNRRRKGSRSGGTSERTAPPPRAPPPRLCAQTLDVAILCGRRTDPERAPQRALTARSGRVLSPGSDGGVEAVSGF